MAIARSGALTERVGLGIQLLLASCQRRRAIIGASAYRFHRYAETLDEVAWFLPPYFRKTSKRGSADHLVPIVGWGAHAFQQLKKLVMFEDAEGGDLPGWLFPGRGSGGTKHADVGILNDVMEVMPGCDLSPHRVRYAFTDFIATVPGCKPTDAGIILDHLEGSNPRTSRECSI